MQRFRRSFGCETIDIRTEGSLADKIHAITGARWPSTCSALTAHRTQKSVGFRSVPRVQRDKHTRPPVFLRHQHGMPSSGVRAGQRDVDSAVDCVGFEARGAGKAAAGEVPAQVGQPGFKALRCRC